MQTSLYTCKGNVYALFGITVLLLISGCGTTSSTVSKCSLAEEMVTQTKQQAEAGGADAQFRVAGWYRSGHCLPHDFPEAMAWYHRSAEQGHLDAQLTLSEAYLGEGYLGYGRVHKDEKEAEKWLIKAAEQGDSKIQMRLAYFYRNQRKDIDTAVIWYRKAAEQGEVEAQRALGSIYLNGEGVTKDLDEAGKWYDLAAKQNDIRSQRQLQIIKEQNPEWLFVEKLRRAEQERRRAVAQAHAQKAKTRFGSVSISVIEVDESKQYRAEVRKKLGSWPELKSVAPSSSGASSSGEVLGGALYTVLYTGPAAPFALAGIGVYLVVDSTYKGLKKTVKTRKEKAEVRPAIKTLTRTLAQANPEKDLMAELQATAARRQAPSLPVTDSGNAASNASHQLVVQLEQLQIVQSPNSRHYGHLWAATEVKLTSRRGVDAPVEKRICYISPPFSFVGVATNSTLEFQERISNAYQNLSSQILSEVLGLAPDADIPSPSRETVKWCESAIVSIKVAGGYYTGEMKDGKRHGSGEMRYAKGNWLTIYRGNFVNDKEHGEGRCKLARGDWMRCTYSNGSRVATY